MNPSPLYWLEETIPGLLAFLSVYVLLGIPWSMIALPHKDWGKRITVVALAFALGPTLLTGWMFILGTIGAAQENGLLRLDFVLGGILILFIIGVALAWRKSRNLPRTPLQSPPLSIDEKFLIGFIILAVILRWLTTSFWTFTAYDPLWVYGYEGRLYFLTQSIPQYIDYYPQFLPLQYTFGQLVYGAINDHAARAVIPLLHIGSILAVYVLGNRLFNRRTGIFAAAIWSLYPHVGDWAHVGDLEIPLTFLFTLAAAFFLMAWTAKPDEPRRRYAALAGIVFGIALWTKPTAGAFAWGVMLLVVIDLIRVRFDFRQWWSRFEVAFITGVACALPGGIWYIRNLALGHNAIDFPPPFWLTQARRSGDLFGFLLLALLILLAYLYLGHKERPTWQGSLLGLFLILGGVLPSMPWLNPARYDPPTSRMGAIEWLLIGLGVVILAYTLHQYARPRWTQQGEEFTRKIGWALLLALPYLATFYYSYSYHYRLLFAIVPLIILPTAVILAIWFKPEMIDRWSRPKRLAYLAAILLMSIPGIFTTLFDTLGQTGWLWSDQYLTDDAKYRAQNHSLISVIEELGNYEERTGTQPIVIAPGEQRVTFFYPLINIDGESTPTKLDELGGATHFIYGTLAQQAYRDQGIQPFSNQVVSALGRDDIFNQPVRHDDGTFLYELYELELDNRFQEPEDSPILHLLEDEVIIGGAVRYVGDNVTNNLFFGNNRIPVEFMFEVLQPLTEDYSLYVHLVNQDNGGVYATWDSPIARDDHGYYSTLLWEVGENIIEPRILQLEETDSIPNGNNYRIQIGLYTPSDNQRLPVTINGEDAGDGIELALPFTVAIPD